MLVVDASVAAGWVLPDETGETGVGGSPAPLLASAGRIVAPWLFWAEFRNVLVMSERRGRLPAGAVEEAVAAIEGLGIVLDTMPSGPAVLDLARRHGLTVYDALYLELALRLRGRLATRDAALRRAAGAEGVAAVT